MRTLDSKFEPSVSNIKYQYQYIGGVARDKKERTRPPLRQLSEAIELISISSKEAYLEALDKAKDMVPPVGSDLFFCNVKTKCS